MQLQNNQEPKERVHFLFLKLSFLYLKALMLTLIIVYECLAVVLSDLFVGLSLISLNVFYGDQYSDLG